MGSENWPDRFPGGDDSEASRTARDLSFLTQQARLPACIPVPSPAWHSPRVFSEHHSLVTGSALPQSKSQGSHHFLGPGVVPGEHGPSVDCDKGSRNLPLHVRVGGREAEAGGPATSSAAGQHTEPAAQTGGRTWQAALMLTC